MFNAPPELLLEMVDAGLDPELPRQGNEHVRRYLELKENDEEVPAALLELAYDWVQKQVALWTEAQELVILLESRHPTPGPDEIIAGDVVFPPWHGKREWMILRGFPWAEDLLKSIEVAREWADAEEPPPPDEGSPEEDGGLRSSPL